MADTFTSGTAGRVRIGAGSTVVAGITKWSISKTATVIPIPHFESTADADGVIHPSHLVGLAGPHTITIEGYFNSDATNKTDGSTIGIKVGVAVTIDLLITRTPLGYIDVVGTVTRFNADVAVENQPARFTAEIAVNGSPGNTA